MKFGFIAAALLLSLNAPSFADDATQAPPAANAPSEGHHHHHHMKKVFEACAKANGITLPAHGSGDSLSSGDRATLHACVKEFRENVHTCLQNAGISKPVPGTKPSDADIAAFKQCGASALAKIKGSN